MERVILQCLEGEPADRPRSAHEVLAALPGGDPLQAALAAGETPSPQVVADAGEVGAIRPWVGLLLLAGVAAALAALAFLNNFALFRRVPLNRPPEEMARQAGQILADIGYPDPPTDRVFRYRVDLNYMQHLERTKQWTNRWEGLETGQPALVYFFYRQSPDWLAVDQISMTTTDDGRLTPDNPAPVKPGMAEVRLDFRGRLIYLSVVPPRDAGGETSNAEPDWGAPFRAAGLEQARFTPDTPKQIPPGPCDRRAAWVGEHPERPGLPLRVEAAAWGDRPVYFQLVGDWAPPRGPDTTSESSPGYWVMYWMTYLAPIVVGLLLAVRNLVLGRADWRGAWRLGLFAAAADGLCWLIGGHHVPAFFAEEVQVLVVLAGAAYVAGLTVLLYLAMEPFLRRRWAWRLTSLNRLLAGRWRDPMVGRDLLLGLLAGIGWLLRINGGAVLPVLFGRPAGLRFAEWSGELPGLSFNALEPPARALEHASYELCNALVIYTLVFLLVLVLRKPWLCWVVFIAVRAALPFMPGARIEAFPSAVLLALTDVMFALVLIRLGVLSLACAFWSFQFLALAVPLTWDPHAWYFGQGLIGALIVIALAVFGFVTATAGQRLFRKGFFGDD